MLWMPQASRASERSRESGSSSSCTFKRIAFDGYSKTDLRNIPATINTYQLHSRLEHRLQCLSHTKSQIIPQS